MLRPARALVSVALTIAVGVAAIAQSAAPLRPASGARDPVLQPGDSGDAVRILQDLLCAVRRRQGLQPIAIDGRFGPGTAAAVVEVQRARGLAATGAVNAVTWGVIHALTLREPLGAIDPVAPPLAPDVYGLTRGGGLEVALHLLAEQETAPGIRSRPILFESKMAVDADGAGDAWRADPAGQPATSLRYPDGTSLDPTVIPYFVLAGDFRAHHPDCRPGDVAAVVHKGRVAYAIWGDVGPRGVLGEGSIALARTLAINADPVHGGVSSGVFYLVFPGSGDRRPLAPAEIARRGALLLRRAGGNP